MISIKFEEREKIGLQYALETLHGWRRSCTTWSRRPTPPES